MHLALITFVGFILLAMDLKVGLLLLGVSLVFFLEPLLILLERTLVRYGVMEGQFSLPVYRGFGVVAYLIWIYLIIFVFDI